MFKEDTEKTFTTENVSPRKYTNNILPFQQMLNEKIEIPPPIIDDGILPEKAILIISGKPKVRKTFLTQNLAIALATGRSFAIFRINEPHKVMILSAEGGIASNYSRMRTMCESRDIKNIENLYACLDTRWQLDRDGDLAAIEEKIKEIQPDVVIFDPLVRFHCQDENSAQGMANLFGKIRKLVEDNDISVIIVHHLGKNESAGLRGSSIISGEYDSHICISPGKRIQALHFDMRHVEVPEKKDLRFNPKTLWFERDEHPVIATLNELENATTAALVETLVKKGSYSSKGGAYKAIKKLKRRGVLRIEAKS
jgi:archaellum biogenesis ATPase FlaH